MAKKTVLDELLSENSSSSEESEQHQTPLPYPAIRKLGTMDCYVCNHEVAVLETKKGRPFVSCGYCFVRMFFNGNECTKRIRRRMTPVPSEEN